MIEVSWVRVAMVEIKKKERERREFWECENKKVQEWDAQKRTGAWPNVSGLVLVWVVATNR